MDIIEYHQITFDEYLMAKEEIARRLRGMSEDFVVIGHLLRTIRDTESYKNEGYESINDFAKKEYGLNETSVSRFIAINKRFSIDGGSRELLPEYENFGISKLSEMLTLSDEDCRLITKATTIATIRDIKKLNKEGESVVDEPVTDKVVEDEQNIVELNNFQKIIIEFFKSNGLYNTLFDTEDCDKLAELINPSGNCTFKHKVNMLFLYEDCIMFKKFGLSNEKYSWEEFIAAAKALPAELFCVEESKTVKEDKVKDISLKEMTLQETKVAAVGKEEKGKEIEIEETEEIATSQEVVEVEIVEEEIKGQKTIMDYPEYLPADMLVEKKPAKPHTDYGPGLLTWSAPTGSWGLCNGYPVSDIPEELYGALCKLRDYEQTGLSPWQVQDLKEARDE